jgi:hypothetical protein
MAANIIVHKQNTPIELSIIQTIHEIRGVKVILDFDLAKRYGVETRVLKQSVKRNIERFPSDFMFQLTKQEWNELITNCDEFNKNIKHTPITPLAFTEHGVAMLSGLLNSEIAINTNIAIMRAFGAIRQYALNYSELNEKIEKLIGRADNNDVKVEEVFKMLSELLSRKKQLEKPYRKPGFITNANRAEFEEFEKQNQ